MRRKICLAVLAFPAFFVLSATWIAAQESSSWESLPEETVVALRIPDGQAFAEAMRKTKFGTVLFSEKRKAAVAKVLESKNSGEWAEYQQLFQEYGLTTDDFLGLLAGESGYALVMTEAEEPMFAGLGWLEPGEELAEKFYEALAKVIDEQDDELPTTRVDLTLADVPVMQLKIPSINVEYDDEYDLSDDYSELSEEEQEEALEKAVEKWEESAVETISYNTLFVGKLGGRLLIAHSYEDEEDEAAAATTEQLSALLGQWIKAHATGSEGFAPRLTDEPGAARVMALEGLPVFELLGDVTPLMKLLRASAPSEEKAEQVVRIFGLDGLGPFAMRSTVEGTEWRTQISLAVPAPRLGLMQLLDQEPLAVDPPQWVPTSAVRFYQWSFDLGKAYEIIKEAALREFPDQASGGFTMVEMQVQNFAKASLPEVLSSLGNRHIIMSFGLESAELDDDDLDVSQRVAVVWQIEDEELWTRLLQAIKPFAGMAPGTEFTEEQGFSGWRMKRGTDEGGLFLGKGYLVLGFGSGVIESVLSSLNNPPAGDDALRGSEVFAKASAMIDLEPALAVEITDGERYMNMAINAMNKQLKQASELTDVIDDDEDKANGFELMLSLARTVMPSHDEIDGMMGVIVGRWEVNEDGVFGNSVQEMPGK